MILIDEFGKGTSPNDGIAIFASTVKYLCQRPERPFVIAITHFHEIYQCDLLPVDLPITWCTMDMLEEGSGALTFLYKVVSGKAGGSLGIRCAKMAGLPNRVIERAEILYELYQAKVPPVSIRYAQINPEIEQVATEIILSIMGEKPKNIDELRVLAQRLLT